MPTPVDAAFAKLRAARFELYLAGQQRTAVVLRRAKARQNVIELNQKIAEARVAVRAATDELLHAMAAAEKTPQSEVV